MSDEFAPVPTPTPAPAASGLSDNSAGALAYVTIIPAIIFLVLEPYNKSAFVRFHSWQSIFFGIAFAVAHIVLGVIPVVGWLVLMLLDLGFLVLWIITILKASKGEKYKLPFLGDLAAKQAGA